MPPLGYFFLCLSLRDQGIFLRNQPATNFWSRKGYEIQEKIRELRNQPTLPPKDGWRASHFVRGLVEYPHFVGIR
uniref:Unclassified n=1 Tax=Fusarium pseudograminearum CS5834 TaxID=1318459 RepID=W1IB40_FUSPS|nr:unclassified [Fusarium pseudograminearum CS5834]CDX48209.1 unclassified [Fusarium pseudograminearum CS5834]